MPTLFEIETADVYLSWESSGRQSSETDGVGSVSGRLLIESRRKQLVFDKIWRAGVPENVSFSHSLTIGPPLFEQTEYKLYVRSKNSKQVKLAHVDPNVCKGLISKESGKLVFGSVNFRSEVGFSRFIVLVDGQPEFDFEVEVFPTKLDYKSDYEQLVAETQDYISGLIFEYLRSTYHLSLPNLAKQSSNVEWLLLLKMVIQELELAANYIAHRPIRGLIREPQMTKAERIKRLDSSVRSSVSRGGGSGEILKLSDDFELRQRLPARKTSFTLDTPEHRWLFTQLNRIRERLIFLREQEQQRENTPRRLQIISEFKSLEQRILQVQQLEPFKACRELPPAGFASLQLLSAPGYRECYRACTVLSLGLQVEGGPINLSIKEISLLYEYWSYLTLLNLLSQKTGQPVPFEKLVRRRDSGLELMLIKGKESSISFTCENDRRITAVYNKQFSSESVLVPQQPDIMIKIEDAGWPAVNLLLDAKYRINLDQDFVKQYCGPGPNIDAVNSLHRYRDAILEPKQSQLLRPKRTVVQAAAVFPYQDENESFRSSRLWKSLEELGIGAIPLLPGCKKYLDEWIAKNLQRSGWSAADGAITYGITDRAQDWRTAASEAVLIGVLRTEVDEQHLQWILENKCYYMPLLKSHPRQLSAKWVAIYVPSSIRKPGAVLYKALVKNIDVLIRKDISTPWASSSQNEDLCVLYQFDQIEMLSEPIENIGEDGKGERFSVVRWSSRLPLEKAKTLKELFLETEPEWRLYEGLRAAGISFSLEPARVGSLKEDELNWRTWFRIGFGFKVRYAGMHGFILVSEHGQDECLPNVASVTERLLG